MWRMKYIRDCVRDRAVRRKGKEKNNMSRIEQLINEIEEYIDSCKFQPLSTSKIIVNKGGAGRAF